MKPPFSLRTLVLLAALVPVPAQLHAKIGALGRIIPAGDLLVLSGGAEAVSAVSVKEGSLVDAGTALITFQSRQAAENDVKLAQLSLHEADDLGKLSLESLDLKTQIAKRDYEFARQRYERFSKLGGEELSAQQMEVRAYQMNTTELAYKAAQKDLARSEEDRAMKIDRAKTQLAMAEDKLARTTLRSPAKLTVVKLTATVGVGGSSVTLANLAEMDVLTEVFAGDLPTLKIGQSATVTSTALPGPVKGKVVSISSIITGRAKVAEVLIRLDDPSAATKLINLEVNVSIDN
jgi:multidrug resistance efflux pump